jgi:hypothetical protein
MTEQASKICVATRKDGRPCRGMGQYFDPQRNGVVCDAHAGPEINTTFQQRMQTLTQIARKHLAEAERLREALQRRLTDDDLQDVLSDLRRFREGHALKRKVSSLLKEILTENSRRRQRKD